MTLDRLPATLSLRRTLFLVFLMSRPQSDSEIALSLRRLLALRWIAIGAQLGVALLTYHLFGGEAAIAPAIVVCAAQAVLNVVSARLWQRGRGVTTRTLFTHLLVDVAALTVVVYFAGGGTNPLITLYLPLIAVGATILPARFAGTLAAVSIACCTFASLFHREVPVHDHERAFQLHLVGMWMIFVFSAAMITWFVARMSAAIRRRDAALAQAREDSLRNERVVALGNLAAGAAHELGTPLATMAVLAGELAQHRDLPADARADIDLMRTQLDECKRIITRFAARAGNPRAEDAEAIALEQWIERLIDRWCVQRPSVAPRVELRGNRPGPRIAADATLEQALLNLFNNAADASPSEVAIDARWAAEELRVEVLDRGPGIDPEIGQRLGRDPVTTRGEGHGFGVVLAQSAIQRVGGSLSFSTRYGGGTAVQVRLPLAAIAAG